MSIVDDSRIQPVIEHIFENLIGRFSIKPSFLLLSPHAQRNGNFGYNGYFVGNEMK